MLLEAVHHVRERGGDEQLMLGNLFGQEKNLTTSAIARMNLFLHGVEDFQVVRGDTLPSRPSLGATPAAFDWVLANPPYSIKQWDRQRGRPTPRAATSTARRPRAAPTSRSGSTS